MNIGNEPHSISRTCDCHQLKSHAHITLGSYRLSQNFGSNQKQPVTSFLCHSLYLEIIVVIRFIATFCCSVLYKEERELLHHRFGGFYIIDILI